MISFFARRRFRRALDEAAGHLAAGRTDDAIVVLEPALGVGRSAFGPTARELATPLYALASALSTAGRLDDAAARAREALEILSAHVDDPNPADGDDDVDDVRLLELLAAIEERRAASGTEATDLGDVLGRYHGASSKDPVRRATAANQLALHHARAGRREQAAPLFQESIRLRREALGRAHLATLEALYNDATFREPTRSPIEIATQLEEVISALEAASSKDPRRAALHESALHNLAVVREEQGKLDDARTLYDRALKLRQDRLGQDEPSLRATLSRLARLHHLEGRIVFALPLYERAIALAKAELGPEHAITRGLEAWRRELTEGD